LFKVWATLTNREGTDFLYTDYRGAYEKATPQQAKDFIETQYGHRT